MQQVKIFKGLESELQTLEGEINAWIKAKGVNVVNIFGNIAPQTPTEQRTLGRSSYGASDIFLVVVYERVKSDKPSE